MLHILYEVITSTICTEIIDLEEIMKPFSMLIKFSNEDPYSLLVISKFIRHLSFFDVPAYLQEEVKILYLIKVCLKIK